MLWITNSKGYEGVEREVSSGGVHAAVRDEPPRRAPPLARRPLQPRAQPRPTPQVHTHLQHYYIVISIILYDMSIYCD